MPAVALLVLEDGSVHLGAPFGAAGIAQGPADFCVEMNGEYKALTDSDHAGKILVMTSPHVGISGFDSEAEPTRITATGLVIREGARPASWTRRRELVEELKGRRGNQWHRHEGGDASPARKSHNAGLHRFRAGFARFGPGPCR